MAKTYKNNSEHELVIIGLGVVEAGATFTTSRLIENPNITEVNGTENEQPRVTQIEVTEGNEINGN